MPHIAACIGPTILGELLTDVLAYFLETVKSLLDYTYCFCMHVQIKPYPFDNLGKEFASSLQFIH